VDNSAHGVTKSPEILSRVGRGQGVLDRGAPGGGAWRGERSPVGRTRV